MKLITAIKSNWHMVVIAMPAFAAIAYPAIQKMF